MIGAAITSGSLLAILFWAAYSLTKQSAYSQRESELRSAMGALIGDSSQLETDEFNESHPEMSFTVFRDDGSVELQQGRLRPSPFAGFQTSDDIFAYGRKQANRLVVVGSDWRENARSLARFAVSLGIMWAPLTLLFGTVAWFVAGSIFLPLQKLTEQAARISGSDLHERLSTSDRRNSVDLPTI